MMKRSLFPAIIAGIFFYAAIVFASVDSSYLRVFGWSKDSKYWAFGEQGDYSGGAMLGITTKNYVVDAATNKFYKTYEKEISERTGVEDEDRIESEIEAFSREVKAKLKALGFGRIMGREVYKKPTMKWIVGDIEIKQFGSKRVSFNANGKAYEIKLADEVFTDEDNPWGSKSKFSLSIRRKGGSWKVLQADKKPWRNFIAYRIIYVSVSPDGSHVAVVVEAIKNAFENSKIPHYKAVTGMLP